MRTKAYIKDDFKNLIEFRNWCKTQSQSLSWSYLYNDANVEAKFKAGTYGQRVTVEEVKNGVQTFKYPELISKLESEIEGEIDSTTANSIPKRKLAYNDIGLGVFSFDMAAQGMYRLKELYSPIHNAVFEPDEVNMSVPGHFHLIADNSLIIERLEEKPDGKPKIRTSNKKVFAYFPKVNRQRAAVEIFVSCGNYSFISTEDFLYSGMVALIIAKMLIKASIPVKINTVIGWEGTGANREYCCAVVPLKNYNEPLDENLLAYATSDPAFWRHEGYKGCQIVQQHFGKKQGGAGVIGSTLKQIFESNNYRIDVPNRFYFGRVSGRREALSQIKQAVEQIKKSIK